MSRGKANRRGTQPTVVAYDLITTMHNTANHYVPDDFFVGATRMSGNYGFVPRMEYWSTDEPALDVNTRFVRTFQFGGIIVPSSQGQALLTDPITIATLEGLIPDGGS